MIQGNSLPSLVKCTAILMTALALASCKDAEELSQRVSIKLDPSLSKSEKEMLRNDIEFMATRDFGDNQGRWFKEVFSGDSAADSLSYLDHRVGAVLSEDVSISSRLRLFEISSGGTLKKESELGTVIASNVGTALFIASVSNEIALQFKIGNSKLPLKDPRIGIIQLGPGYTHEKYNYPVHHSATLVHEGRHSDCTGGFNKKDFEKVQIGQEPLQSSCGHLHVKCPIDHPLAGELACDGHAWGAYAIGAVYANELAFNCKNCSEFQKQQALAVAAESWTRIDRVKELVDGKRGKPNMSSTALVNKDEIMLALRNFHRERKKDATLQSSHNHYAFIE